MFNLFAQLQSMTAATDPLLIGDVIDHDVNGYSLIQLPGGGLLRARGTTVNIGLRAFVQGGAVLSEAPALPIVIVEV